MFAREAFLVLSSLASERLSRSERKKLKRSKERSCLLWLCSGNSSSSRDMCMDYAHRKAPFACLQKTKVCGVSSTFIEHHFL